MAHVLVATLYYVSGPDRWMFRKYAPDCVNPRMIKPPSSLADLLDHPGRLKGNGLLSGTVRAQPRLPRGGTNEMDVALPIVLKWFDADG